MSSRYYFASLTRISDFERNPFGTEALPREVWETADYVVGEVLHAPRGASVIEGPGGRLIEVVLGDLVVGALGTRAATLGAVGDWRAIGPDGEMEALTMAGLFGLSTSVGWDVPGLMRLGYRGHVVRDGEKVSMRDFVPTATADGLQVPTVLIVGTSMSAGKTSAAKLVIRKLRARGLRVVGAKLTGAGRYRDILAMKDAGANAVYDFVDAGLPSTVCPQPDYREALGRVLAMIATEAADVLVVEAGASPLEPYNGSTLLAHIKEQVRCRILAATDPYAVVGVVQGYGISPDLVAGIAANTSAGRELIHELTGLEALNIHDPASHPRFTEILTETLGEIEGRGGTGSGRM
ncbi:MAG: DUF1611 domain-containing protein [Gemmatimonadota bacterium]|jgi:hypothetical protein